MAANQAQLDKLFGSIFKENGQGLLTIEVTDLIEKFAIEDYVLRENENGGEYMQLINPKGRISIGISPKLSNTLTKRGQARIDEILDKGTIYFGFERYDENRKLVPTDKPWLVFSIAGDASASIIATKKVAGEPVLQNS